jgi:3-phosphoglycerate kinase
MNYCERLGDFKLDNLYKKLGESPGPLLIRVDINVPLDERTGKISMNPYNLRLEEYSHILDLYSSFAPVVVLAHQGRNDGKDKNFVNLHNHQFAIGNITQNANRVLYEPEVEGEEYLGRRLQKEIKSLELGDILILENVRNRSCETKFESDTCPYIPFFKKAGIESCINDGLPLWHRAHSSVMSLPYIKKTYVGLISAKELEIQHRIMNDGGNKIMIMGGKKPKAPTVPALAKKMDIMTGGLTGQIFCRLKGYDLGDKNNKEVKRQINSFNSGELELLQVALKKYDIKTPKDFVVSINGDFKEVGIDELKGTDYYIEDMGPATVDEQITTVWEGNYDWIISGGSVGRYELGYNNRIKVIKKILGKGFVALGGDTIEELQRANICKPIEVAGGHVLLGGGAHLEGWAENNYPSIDEMIRLQN